MKQQTITTESNNRPYYLIAWRWHFYAGLLVIPFFIMLSVTGLVMLFANALDARYGEQIYVTPAETMTTPIAQVQAAGTHFPDTHPLQYMPPAGINRTAVVQLQTTSGSIVFAAVNPYTNEILRGIDKESTAYYLASNIHGTLLIGDWGDRLIEMAASLGFVMLATGLYLWWPQGGIKQAVITALIPSVKKPGRSRWKVLHISTGFYITLPLIFFLFSGLAWAGVWGEKLVQPWNTFCAEKWGNIPLSDDTHDKMNHGASKEVPWGLEKTAMPLSGSKSGLAGLPPQVPVNLTTVVQYASSIGFGPKFRINLPKDDTGVYTISADSMDGDIANPTDDRTVHIDQHTGNVLAEVTYDDYSWVAKSMAVGTALHQGDLGIVNVLLNTLFCMAILFLCISGIVMWWLRRPAGKRWAAPPLPANVPRWKSATAVMMVLSIAFPLAGVAILSAVTLDFIVQKTTSAFRRLV